MDATGGMTQTHKSEGVEERPLVTFALFAYNQEKYIREAVEGAFSQAYEPLEIILSDDCSTDRTFEIMREMAAEYRGPHRVRVRQSDENAGTLAHVLQVADVARGRYLIVAAGDDISLPRRTEVQTEQFRKTPNLVALTSGSIPFRSSEDLSRRNDGFSADIRAVGNSIDDIGFVEVPHHQFHGCAAAYRISFLHSLPMPATKVLHEDVAIAFGASLKGKIVGSISAELILYRQLENSLSCGFVNEASVYALVKNEDASQRFATRHLENFRYYRLLANEAGRSSDFLDEHYNLAYLRAYWFPISGKNFFLLSRIKTLAAARYVAPRLFGKAFFCRAKFAMLRLKLRLHLHRQVSGSNIR